MRDGMLCIHFISYTMYRPSLIRRTYGIHDDDNQTNDNDNDNSDGDVMLIVMVM